MPSTLCPPARSCSRNALALAHSGCTAPMETSARGKKLRRPNAVLFCVVCRSPLVLGGHATVPHAQRVLGWIPVRRKKQTLSTLHAHVVATCAAPRHSHAHARRADRSAYGCAAHCMAVFSVPLDSHGAPCRAVWIQRDAIVSQARHHRIDRRPCPRCCFHGLWTTRSKSRK